MVTLRRLSLALGALFLAGCSTTYPVASQDLDSGNHTNVVPPNLVSVNVASPSAAQLAAPVVIAVHGFGATLWELKPTTDFLRAQGLAVSEVQLGAHGTYANGIKDFENSNWRIWQQPILTEYRALKEQGYQDIRFFTTSTGGTLVLEAMARKVLVPTKLAMVAPLVEIKNKLAGYAGVLPFVGVRYRESVQLGESIGRWYRFNPASTIISLVDLTEILKADLKSGLPLPEGTEALVIQSDGDGTVDPISADLLKQGLSPEARVHVTPVHSPYHIPVWPDGVDGKTFTTEQDALRTQLIAQIYAFLKP